MNGYTNSEIALAEPSDKRLYEYNAKSINAILCGLVYVEITRFMQCTSAKEIWDSLKSIYEGDENLKRISCKPTA